MSVTLRSTAIASTRRLAEKIMGSSYTFEKIKREKAIKLSSLYHSYKENLDDDLHEQLQELMWSGSVSNHLSDPYSSMAIWIVESFESIEDKLSPQNRQYIQDFISNTVQLGRSDGGFISDSSEMQCFVNDVNWGIVSVVGFENAKILIECFDKIDFTEFEQVFTESGLADFSLLIGNLKEWRDQLLELDTEEYLVVDCNT